MKGEINRDFYCSLIADGEKCRFAWAVNDVHLECLINKKLLCPHRYRKHPTPEQFKEEYGEEWNGAIYVLYADCAYWSCELQGYIPLFEDVLSVVCACTPWGKPPADWRPE